MRLVKLSILVLFLLAGSVNAASLGLQFSDNPGYDIYCVVGEPARIDVVIDLLPGEQVSGIGFTWDAVDIFGNGPLDQVGTYPGPLLDQDQSVNATRAVGFNTLGGMTPLVGPGTFIAGSFEVYGESVWEITFRHETVALLDETGGAYTFGPSYVGVFPHMYDYGFGCPGADAGAYGSQEAYPLVLDMITPEPTSLALLALGGIVLVRRR